MNLSDVIEAAVYKELVLVDLPARGSNQHEINGVKPLRDFFGTSDTTRGRIVWHYLADGQDPVQQVSEFTFYDARLSHPTRTEWRLYYVGDFLHLAEEGDVLVLIRTKNRSPEVHGLVLQKGSSWLRSVEQLFGVTSLNPVNFELFSQESLTGTELGLLGQTILEELGVEDILIPATDEDIRLVSARFDGTFPSTKQMSEFAREQVRGADLANPDDTLVRWLQREEQLFRALERLIVEDQVRQGFESVDQFISFSLSVQNRRKSRMGYALQNNLAALFDKNGIRYEAQARTEGKNKPDFLFPSATAYHDEIFDSALLVMLGAKSTLKERWRQVLTEANRIPNKHLCTLDTAVSRDQTDEIAGHNLRLVIPLPFHQTYTVEQRGHIWSLGTFIEFVRGTQVHL